MESWQYLLRQKYLKSDLEELGFSKDEIENLRVSDLEFLPVDRNDKKRKTEIIEFIKKYEWLGSLPLFPSHWFGVYYKNKLAGALILSTPNSFSKLFEEDTKKIERLISRGACISWSPKNTASSLIMFALNWMVKNTQYKIFCSYADPEAKELGTVYQACNFYYLGQKFGSDCKYIYPYTGKIVSDRSFRNKSAYMKYAKDLNIKWNKNWNTGDIINWKNMPDGVEKSIRDYCKKMLSESELIIPKPKHKYVMVLGSNKKETRLLRSKFLKYNKVLPYPKERGR